MPVGHSVRERERERWVGSEKHMLIPLVVFGIRFTLQRYSNGVLCITYCFICLCEVGLCFRNVVKQSLTYLYYISVRLARKAIQATGVGVNILLILTCVTNALKMLSKIASRFCRFQNVCCDTVQKM